MNEEENMKRIALVGGFSYSDVGDESQLSTDLVNLRKHVPHIEFIVLSDNPQHTKKCHKVKADYSINKYLLMKQHENLYGWKIARKIARFVRYLRMMYFLKGLLFLFNARRLRANKNAIFLNDDEVKLLKNLRDADLLFNVGGGYFTSLNRLELYSKCFTYLICRTFDKPVVLSGLMIGPFNNWFDRYLTKFALDRVNVITLRDKFSKKVLKEIGVTKQKVITAADDASLLPPAPFEKVVAVLSKENINLHRPMIGINMYARGLAFDLGVSHDKLKKTTSLLARVSDYLIQKYGAQVIFISTSFHREADDRVGANNVLKKVKQKDKAFIIKHEYSDQIIKGIIGQMDLVIGTRYHFLVFAATSQIPLIGIYLDEYYSRKIKGILKLVGQEEFACDVETISNEDLINLVETALTRKKTIQKTLQEKTKELEKLSLLSIEYAKKLLS
jgi:polysaccharide pyruvyl transferase WcaK-like protein